jgi:hypothetical protein
MDNTVNIEKFNIPEGVQELVVRTGDAKPFPQKATITQDTTHEGLIRFVNWRIYNTGLSSRMIISYDSSTASALFTESDPLDSIPEYMVKASVKINPIFSQFGINQDKLWSISDLKKKILHRADLFDTVANHKAFLMSLSNINSKIDIEFRTADDFKGNTADVKITKLESNIPTSFTIKTWVYSGEEKRSVNVEFRLLVEGSGVVVSLGSTDLNLYDEEKRSGILAAYMELARITGIVVLEK